MEKSEKEFTLDEFVEYVSLNFPDYCMVKISDYESPDKQTYKSLYEKKSSELRQYEEDLYNANSTIQQLEKDCSELNIKLKKEKSINSDLSKESENFIDFIHKYLSQDVYVSDVKAFNSDGTKTESSNVNLLDPENLPDEPGVYDFKRPCWFSPLQNELNKENVMKKNIHNTKKFFVSRLSLLKKISSSEALKRISDEVDFDRKKNIVKILLSPGSNYEKYLKYTLCTPGLSKEFRDILFNAADLGLDANIVIELLEQPKESFNKEIIENFVSEVHKGTEYNLKQELAEELARGEWYVTAAVSGQEQKFQLVPIEEIKDIKDKLESLSNIFSQGKEPEKSGSGNPVVPSESPEQEIQDENLFPFIYEEENQIPESSSMINFNDSMI
ncbi:MAG: hypothetical protein IJI65_02615 [Lachnospiraceae bacterium]|nr:hypothetical protein [Lachnospiraceae bacterium]